MIVDIISCIMQRESPHRKKRFKRNSSSLLDRFKLVLMLALCSTLVKSSSQASSVQLGDASLPPMAATKDAIFLASSDIDGAQPRQITKFDLDLDKVAWRKQIGETAAESTTQITALAVSDETEKLAFHAQVSDGD